ncbi:MFS family permease [Novosphingobium sp. SG751A]|uniref:spinster family MFS transporter n=1 Tax=Novosphingobium sp. SG751A TaxID=2587000 RepID=UPI0015519234|nr:MFS transporter [Novosphingobium sp. SG751A]NOW45320.1 MFS family permease [Novosphingobium sp. SG751A]
MPESESAYPPPLRAWLVIALLLLAYTVAFVDRQILSLMVQPIRADLGLDDTAISLLHGFAFAIFYTFLGLFLGRRADQGSRKALMVGGMVLWCLATVACGFAKNFTQLFIARIFVGVGEATLSPAAYSLISDSFAPAKRGRAMSVYTMGVFVGSGLALVLGGMAVTATSGHALINMPLAGLVRPWQAAFMVVGLPGLLVAALMLLLREPPRRERAGQTMPSLAQTLAFFRARAATIGCIVVGFGVNSIISYGLSAWVPSLFIRVHHWAAADIALAYGLVLLTAGCGGILTGGWLADRMTAAGHADGPLRVSLLGMLAVIPVVPFVGLGATPAVSLAALAWTSFFLGVPTGIAPAALHAITPNEYRGQVTALYLFAINLIGLGFGPTLVALTTDHLFVADLAVGRSLALVTGIASVLAFALIASARRGYGKAV